MRRRHVIMIVHSDDDCEVLTRHWFYFMACFKLWLNRKLNGDPLEDYVVATRLLK